MTDSYFAGAGGSYHFRPDGEKCPRGHRGPFRNSRFDCAECRCNSSRCWAVTRCAVHSVIHGSAMAPKAIRTIGTTPGDFLQFLAEGCARLGVRLEDYGSTWGIYRCRELRDFNLESDADFLAANRLENLKVARLHNAPRTTRKRSDDRSESPQLFPQ